jgi:hypothetical protein
MRPWSERVPVEAVNGAVLLLSEHARQQAARRGVPEDTVMDVAVAPEQVIAVRAGRAMRQNRVTL